MKPHNPLSNAIRYERVQRILERDPAIRRLLSPQRYRPQNRLGRRISVCKEAIEVTNAVHAAGNDAIKVSKNIILKTAARLLKVFTNTGQVIAASGRGSIGESKADGRSYSSSSGGPVEFVENPGKEDRLCNSLTSTSTNSTGGPALEDAVIPPNSLFEAYLKLARKQVESADSYIIGAILPVAAACLARRVYFPWGEERIYCNLFTMLAGRSGDRKSTGINWCDLLAKAVLAPETFLPHNCSAESLFDEYDVNCGGSPDKVLLADDANPILGTWTKSGYGERVGQRFLNLYDCKSLTESFEKNRKSDAQGKSRRVIPETSTSIVFGAGFDICRLQGRGISSGLQRRFLFYAAQRHGRLIATPPPVERTELDRLIKKLAKLTELHAECAFSDRALELWQEYQHHNRSLLQTQNDEARLARLNGAPRHVQKVAMLFEISIWVMQDNVPWNGVIHLPSLEKAIQHVDHCLRTATRLDSISSEAELRTSANALLTRIRFDFSTPQNIRGGWIRVTKTQLTGKYASQPHRRHSWKPEDLYLRFIPYLIELGLARLGEKQGKRVCYGFAVAQEALRRDTMAATNQANGILAPRSKGSAAR